MTGTISKRSCQSEPSAAEIGYTHAPDGIDTDGSRAIPSPRRREHFILIVNVAASIFNISPIR